MWISKKKFNQMMAEAMEKEREREQLYRFMDDMYMITRKLEDKVGELEHMINNLPKSGKKQLNG